MLDLPQKMQAKDGDAAPSQLSKNPRARSPQRAES